MKESLVLLLTSGFLLVRTKSVYVSANCLTNYHSPSLKSSRAEKIKAKCILIYGGKTTKAELLQLIRTQFSSVGIFINKKVENRKN